jgi:hypothetical protein
MNKFKFVQYHKIKSFKVLDAYIILKNITWGYIEMCVNVLYKV